MATLTIAVVHVVRVCPKKEVVGSDAGRIIAMVADLHAIGNRTEGQFI